jgi:hypothetical protein
VIETGLAYGLFKIVIIYSLLVLIFAFSKRYANDALNTPSFFPQLLGRGLSIKPVAVEEEIKHGASESGATSRRYDLRQVRRVG